MLDVAGHERGAEPRVAQASILGVPAGRFDHTRGLVLGVERVQ